MLPDKINNIAGIYEFIHRYVSFINFNESDIFKYYHKYELIYEIKKSPNSGNNIINENFNVKYEPIVDNISKNKYIPKCVSYTNSDEIYEKSYIKSCRVYVVWFEIFTKETIEKLKPYCRCRMCTTWNPFTLLFACRCCCGCLHSDKYNEFVVYDTRKYVYDTYTKKKHI